MKKHNLEYIIGAILAFTSSIITLNIISTQKPTTMLLGFIVFLIVINISSILFYKSLKVDKKWMKFPFSFINLICYIILGALTGIKIIEFLAVK